MSSLNYVTGSWTVKSGETDSISTPKTLALPDLDFAHDYSVSSESGKEVRIINTTGGTLNPVEKLRFGRERVADIYRSTDVPAASKLPSSAGIRVLMGSDFDLFLSNSVTGAELVAPIRVWTCMESSTHNAITDEALLWAYARHMAEAFNTGDVTAAQIVQLFRGDLDPTR
jgi:hypothetical protein